MSNPPRPTDVLRLCLEQPSTLAEIAEYFDCKARQAESVVRTLKRKRLIWISQKVGGAAPGRKANRWSASVGADVIEAMSKGEIEMRMQIRTKKREAACQQLQGVAVAWGALA